MLMLMCRPSGRLVNGATRRVPIVRRRERKFGPVLEERVLSIKKDVLISGPNSSRKTRWLAKLDEKAAEVWSGHEKLFVRALEPLQRWYEDARIAAYALSKGKTWAKLRSYEKNGSVAGLGEVVQGGLASGRRAQARRLRLRTFALM